MKVSVIIPSYNRGHLLEKTIPTYIQDNVIEIIIIDDCSKDNTKEIVEKMKEKYSLIKYYKMDKNSKQQAAKNKKIEMVSQESKYIYFGDDDAILNKNSINFLSETMEKYNADLVGARALWAKTEEDINNLPNFISKNNFFTDELINFDRDEFNFDKITKKPMEVPVTHAYFLIKKEALGETRFSLEYKGNAYREETDFILQIHKKRKKIMYDARAVGINLPRYIATGGAHKKGVFGKVKWFYWAIKNNNLFLEKNYEYLKKENLVHKNKLTLKVFFIFSEGKRLVVGGIKKLIINKGRKI